MDMLNRQIILASGSPRRLDILRAHGFGPRVVVPNVDEQDLRAALPLEISPGELVQQLALHKARAVFLNLKDAPSIAGGSQDAFILAADTIVYQEGIGTLEKPACHEEAVWMLQTLCDTTHQVFTGVAVIDTATARQQSLVDETTVTFGAYDLSEIEDYLASEPPYDKAGSYAIQGRWSKHVTAIKGDLENVIGLPYHRLQNLLNNLAY